MIQYTTHFVVRARAHKLCKFEFQMIIRWFMIAVVNTPAFSYALIASWACVVVRLRCAKCRLGLRSSQLSKVAARLQANYSGGTPAAFAYIYTRPRCAGRGMEHEPNARASVADSSGESQLAASVTARAAGAPQRDKQATVAPALVLTQSASSLSQVMRPRGIVTWSGRLYCYWTIEVTWCPERFLIESWDTSWQRGTHITPSMWNISLVFCTFFAMLCLTFFIMCDTCWKMRNYTMFGSFYNRTCSFGFL